MNKRTFILFMSLLLILAVLSLGVDQGRAQSPTDEGLTQGSQNNVQSTGQTEQKKSYQQRRREANERLKAALGESPTAPAQPEAAVKPPLAAAATPTGINPAVDVTLPNYANSPNLRKFVDSLPGLGGPGCTLGTPGTPTSCNENNLGQFIPIAAPTANPLYPGSDYYEIGLSTYTAQMHSDLPATKLRGYKNLLGAGAAGANHYLGPVIIAHRDRAVRFKFVNLLPAGAAGNLLLPMDTTVMGDGQGPLGAAAVGTKLYTQNRATIHLHGGLTPWISDGTPHQWVTPAGTNTSYKKGIAFQNVPDMIGAGKTIPAPAAGDGMGTFYYPNQQSARLMFYHDHAYGITRLNVYAGEAAGYLLTDQVEEDLIAGTNVSGGNPASTKILPDLGGVYHYGIPLIIQDKTFVNDGVTPPGFPPLPPGVGTATPTPATSVVDPLWSTYVHGTGRGDFWFPHEYMPNENIYDPTGFNVMGRWDYAPWMIPPMLALNNTLPSPTIIPEAFMDTPIVNGTAYPYITLPPTAVRFRILNACNDRMLNLQWYYAADATGAICKGPSGPTTGCTEVSMVPAAPNPAFPTWPKDGRDGGVPDPLTAGPDMWQIGNEGGFLAKVAVVPPQPVDFDYSRRSVTFGGVTSKSLFMGPAFRVDVVVDFSSVPPGSTLILYNDAPAPMPLYDTRYDYFTDGPDQTPIGGAPTIPPGFGPNTRTIMQIKIAGTPSAAFNLAALQTALPKAFAVGQDKPLVPETAYNAAFPGFAAADVYGNSVDETLNVTGAPQSIAFVMTELPGLGYTTPPAVNFYGGGGTGAAATATLNGVTGVTLVTAGTGCTSPPAVAFTPAVGGGGTGATAVATISGGVVTVITVTNPGSNYLIAPIVTLTGGCTTAPTAVSTITLGSVGSIILTNPGTGYLKAPRVYLTGGGGTGAMAAAMLNGSLVMNGKNLTEGFDMEFGRMNAVLGSTPNPLAPTVGAGPVIGAAFYVDPPTEILTDGQTVLWRLSHIGVDSHAIHFHLFNVQVINRVDWTNTIKPPYDDELGWKETIRTNPFEDIILAIQPKSMTLPFQIPNSNRLLDATTPAGSTANFVPVPPPPGLPAVAQISNVMTNFGWEYVWHCHLLGHEENDMMRPIVFVVPPPAAPTALTAGASVASPLSVTLHWTDNATNETNFTIQRATNAGFTTGLKSFNVAANTTGYVDADPTLAGTTRYYYRVRAWNAAANSAWSNVVNVITAALPLPAAPVLTIGAIHRSTVVLNWTLTGGGAPSSFQIQRATNVGFTAGFVSVTVNTPTLTTFTRGGLTPNTPYFFRVRAINSTGNGPWSNVVTATTLP